jgi:hypothetical protein
VEGFHPVRGCVERLQYKQKQIDTDFAELRARFANGFPASGPIPALSPAYLDGLLAAIIDEAPKQLRQFQQQLADCLHWELQRHGEHVCAGLEVSERTIRALYGEINHQEEPMCHTHVVTA